MPDTTSQGTSLGSLRCARGKLRGAIAAAVLFSALTATLPRATLAADCPPLRPPRLPPIEAPADNIDKHKKQLLAYQAGAYGDDLALVSNDAQTFIEQRLEAVKLPAVVLDIDETSLSNWTNIQANNFGFIKGGPCPEKPDMACGFDEWILKESAPALAPTKELFKVLREKKVAVFFITGRRDHQREATERNLDRAGYSGWSKLVTRPADFTGSIVPFKSGERAKIQTAGYTIVANIGDQDSDIAGGFAECSFKLPNPFYFIE